MALYRSLETDVTAFFIAQGTIFETVVNSLGARVHTLEERPAAVVGEASLEARVARLEDLWTLLTQEVHGLRAQCQASTGTITALSHQIDAQSTSLASHAARLDAQSLALETQEAALEAQAIAQATFIDKCPQQILADAMQKITLGLSSEELASLSQQLCCLENALEHATEPTDEIRASLTQVHADLASIPTDPTATPDELALVPMVERLRKSLAHLGTSLDALATNDATPVMDDDENDGGDTWQSVLSRSTSTSISLPTALAKLESGSIAKELEQQATPMTPLSLHEALAEKVQRLLQAADDQQEAYDARMFAVTTELQTLQDHERELEAQLAACPRQEDVLQQLSLLQDKIAQETNTSSSHANAALDELRQQFQTLPTSDMVSQLHASLKTKADKADIARLQRDQNDQQSTLGLSKIPLKCLSCDQYLPRPKFASTNEAWNPSAPVVSPRNTVNLRPLEVPKRDRATTASALRTSAGGPSRAIVAAKLTKPRVEYVENVVTKLERHRPMTAEPRGYTLQSTPFEMAMPGDTTPSSASSSSLRPPTSSLLSDKQRYSFYYLGNNNANNNTGGS
ncbi:hypothetical protein SPRG_00749 [Saprolegnia parasitica CBS 223.65]|uniref:Uncharacterized protein n=1 Tax=Saprolegnia parasitica (strain CBS 223.65) TaxID=695850 RepID=A0A067CZM6_SAPPC|nr:hypothetical protein SPRG_00749 [Saprolegnia parasitica CBS 223.65]KDO34685.1 hypothetical protein SPRG_00749 [Saprolegnia parasitica CBS 223.65]|eukprot:XP_012194357.1 hypothetical protein SPRG_00749 [Saprolegnia parasitica CBS 223.65]